MPNAKSLAGDSEHKESGMQKPPKANKDAKKLSPRFVGKTTLKERKKCRCEGGTCKSCLQDAEWDRIYKERFEDPTYYSKDNHRQHTTALHDI